MSKGFLIIYNFFEKHRAFFYISLIASFLITGFFAIRIKPEEDISKILPRDRQTQKLNDILQNAKFADKLLVMVSLKDSNARSPDSLIAFSDAFTSALRKDFGSYIHSIQDRISDSLGSGLLGSMQAHLPIYLNGDDYNAIDSLIQPERIREILGQDFRILSSPAGIVLKQLIRADPVGISSLALKKIRQLQYDENFELYDNHIITKDGKYVLLFVSPAYPPDNTGRNSILLEGIDGIIRNLEEHDFRNASASYFGAIAVSAGNARQLRSDSILTLSITVIFLVLFTGWYFRKKRAPFIIMIPVVLGALFSLAVIYFIKGSISVIALAVGSVVLGIAINYSLHVFNHFRHTKDIRAVINDLSFPLTIGSFTTIGGFFCLELVKSEILKDLGLFAAFSLIGAALSSLIFLPPLIADPGRQRSYADATQRNSWIEKLASYHPERNKFIVAGILVLTLFFAYTAFNVRFDSDMMHMNFMPPALKASEARLNKINEYSLRSVYLVTEGKDLQDALLHYEKWDSTIRKLHDRQVLKKYSGVFSLFVSNSLQQVRITRWNRYWTTEKKQQLVQSLQSAGASAGFKKTAFSDFRELLNKNYQPLTAAEETDLRQAFAEDYIIRKPNAVALVTLLKVSPEDKHIVYDAFSRDDHITVIDRQYLADKLVNIVNSDFTSIALMTSILVFVVMLLTYGRLELTLVSFIPMFIAWIWILGIMGLAGLEFNIVNIILSALIFGLGDDYSLFIMDGLLQEYKTGKKNLSSYKSSIVLSAVTTLAGLGVLIFAKHPALRSIALISITGILCVVVIGQILIPFFFNLLITDRVRKNRFPWTVSGLFKSVFSLSYFAFGSILMSVIGLFLVRLNPFYRKRAKYLYHVLLSKWNWSVIYIMGNVKKKISNPSNEDFSRPAVLVSNHQSFLDILTTTMLSPKMILLTNKWVWNSPIFGSVVRMADYYPVALGIENSIDLLSERVKEGYSIAVFPEGTRTVDAEIRRFHKGAFYLAEKLQLDILPVLIHGTAYTMTKGDFLLKDGYINIEYLPRIRPQDESFGSSYTERAKYIGQYFRREYSRLKATAEQPAYFRELLFYNYLYKGPVLEWYLRIKLKLENNYQLFHDLLPKKGKLLDIGCGYGFMSYMLQFAAPERDITGIDYDEEKTALANHCFSKNERIRFFCEDGAAFVFEQYDGIILSDVLHYLEPLQQTLLMEKCMDHLNPGGIMLVRDGDSDLSGRHKGTKLTEFFSTRFTGFNKTSGKGLFYISGDWVKQLAAKKNMQCRKMDSTKYTSNVIFIITHN